MTTPNSGTLPNPDENELEIEPEPEPRPKAHSHPPTVQCGFCESTVTTSRGEVLKMSARAKTLRVADEEIERLKVKLDEANTTITELRQRQQPSNPAPSEKKNWLDDL